MSDKPKARPMSPSHRAAVAPKIGRPKKPSIFLEEVRAAIETGEAYELDIPEGWKASTIMHELDKAAEELKIKIKKWNRSKLQAEAGTPPFVGFMVLPVEPVAVIQPETGPVER